MGFMDKVKGMAQGAMEMAEKTMDQQKQNKVVELKGIEDDGTISSDALKEKVGEKTGLFFFIDKENDRLIVFTSTPGMFSSSNKLVAEYSLKDVVAFQHESQHVSGTDDRKTVYYDNRLILSSGETLKLCHVVESRANYTLASVVKTEIHCWLSTQKVIETFIEKVDDDKTKQWINQFYQEYGEDAPFDEAGKLDMLKYLEMVNELLDKKHKAWLEIIKSLGN